MRTFEKWNELFLLRYPTRKLIIVRQPLLLIMMFSLQDGSVCLRACVCPHGPVWGEAINCLHNTECTCHCDPTWVPFSADLSTTPASDTPPPPLLVQRPLSPQYVALKNQQTWRRLHGQWKAYRSHACGFAGEESMSDAGRFSPFF